MSTGSSLRIAIAAALPLVLLGASAWPEEAPVNTIKDVFARMSKCWQPPPPSRANPIDITVRFSFNRAGEILGHPRITYESEQATDNDRLQYRIAVMQALQRCTPMPFTEEMAGAVAGYPFVIRFKKMSLPPAMEKRAWLLPKIL